MNKKLKKIITTTFLATMCIVMIGCNLKSNSNSATTSLNKEAVEGYPVEITTYNYSGDEVKTTYEKAPEKVLAVYQGSIETMLELGLEDRLVAAAGLDNELDDKYKKAFKNVEYLTEFTPSKETVTALNPDMILSWGSIFAEDKLGDVNTWIDKGCNTYINTNTRRKEGEKRTIQNEMTDILNLGKIFNVEDKSQKIVDNMQSKIDKALKAAEGQEKQNVLMVEFLGDEISNYGANSLGGDMITSLGGNLVAKDQSKLGKEDIVSLNPDVIYVVYMPYSGDDPEQVKQDALDKLLKDKAFNSLDAVKNKRVVPIMLGDMYASGVRTINGIETISAGLYPDLNK
ncbi:ABC transporter substrate-binding protein [Intestinibacter bartlettii]|uniref:ABC transporter substrate-binding protein n=1 Tax=Intestinibacter bartlettii TaxID=261299 RepID=UPI0039F4C8FB